MGDASEYLDKAKDAELQAARAQTESLREVFLRLAQGWRDLALQAKDAESAKRR